MTRKGKKKKQSKQDEQQPSISSATFVRSQQQQQEQEKQWRQQQPSKKQVSQKQDEQQKNITNPGTSDVPVQLQGVWAKRNQQQVPPQQQQQQKYWQRPQTSKAYRDPSQTSGGPSQVSGGPSQAYGDSSQTYGGPSEAYGGPSEAYGGPSQAYGGPSQAYGDSSQTYEGPSEAYGGPSQAYGGPSQAYGDSSQIYEGPSEAYGGPSQAYGGPSQAYGSPSQAYGSPSQAYGGPSQAYGGPSQAYGGPSRAYGGPSRAYGGPSRAYGGPSQAYGGPSQAYGGPSQAYGGPSQAYGGPSQQQILKTSPEELQQVYWGSSQQKLVPQQVSPPSSRSQQAQWSSPQQEISEVSLQLQKVQWGSPEQQQPQMQPQMQQTRRSAIQRKVLQDPQQQEQEKSLSQQKLKVSDNTSDVHKRPSATQTKQISKCLKSESSPANVAQTGKMSTSAMKQYHLSIPQRSNLLKSGTKGKSIRVLSNMFEIIFNKNFVTNAVHYDVNITPIAPKSVHRQVFELCRQAHFDKRYPAFDGKKNVYSAHDLPLPNDNITTKIEYLNENKKSVTYTVVMKKVANVDLSWITHLRPGLDEANRDPTGLQVLDIIMRHSLQLKFISVGRSLHWEVNKNKKLGEGFSLSCGAFQSAILGWKPFLNVDISHKGFPTSQCVIDLIMEFEAENTRYQSQKPISQMSPFLRDQIERYLKQLKVSYEVPNIPHSKRIYRVNGLGKPAARHEFKHGDEYITVANYFAHYKNYKLNYPNMPVLCVGSMQNRSEPIALPPELCTIIHGQNVQKKLSENQTKAMIKHTTMDAFSRQDRIKEAFNKIEVNKSPVMTNEFHLSVKTQMKEVSARILPPPELRYAERTARVNKGVWQLQTFNQAKNLEAGTWTILNLSDPKQTYKIKQFSESLINIAKDVGMRIGQPCPLKNLSSNAIEEITNYFRSNKGLKLIIVIIPDKSNVTYGKVKQITELKVGILTQCVKLQTVTRSNFSTLKNILLKINSKLNGINHTFDTMPTCLRKNNRCMLVGGDVTHPSPDAAHIPSIAAVAASNNNSAFQYNIQLRLQEAKQEMIMDIENIITSQILLYKEKNGYAPNAIIYYRDGVSEGQLAQVMHFEITAIKRACIRCKIDNIPVTCLVVQKRHHVRFFPISPNETDDRNNNVRAGTIVDTEITHPNHIDFYLVSHASIQGTARPTKYRCICNEANFSEDDIEELTYYLCHMYARCTRAVSYPAPTYYAHLAAYRGRALIQEVNISMKNLETEQDKLRMKMAQSPMCFI